MGTYFSLFGEEYIAAFIRESGKGPVSQKPRKLKFVGCNIQGDICLSKTAKYLGGKSANELINCF